MKCEMGLIEAMLSYLENHSPSAELSVAQEEIGDQRLRVVLIKILGWMKVQHRLHKLRPLTMRQEYTWCEDVTMLIDGKGLFLDTFEIRSGSIQLSHRISDRERAELCAFVDQRFNRPLMN